MASRIWNAIFNPVKKIGEGVSSGFNSIANIFQNYPDSRFTNIGDIRNKLNSLEGRNRRQLIDSLLDEFKIKDLRNTETDNVIRILERKMKKEDIPEDNLNEQIFEFQDPKVNIGKNNLRDTFVNNPNAQLRIKLPSGRIVTMSKRDFDNAVRDQETGIDLGFSPSEQDIRDTDLNGDFEILDIYNPDLLDFRRIERKNGIGGIDDFRINIEEHETEDYWCPDNMSCIKKCILKYMKINHIDEDIMNKVKDLKIPDVSKSNTVNKRLEEGEINYRVSFSYSRYQKYKAMKDICVIPLKEVALRNVGGGYSHAVLLKRNHNSLYKSNKEFNNVVATKIELENIQNIKSFNQSRYYQKEEEDEEGNIKIVDIPHFKTDTETFETNPLNIMTFDYESYQNNEINQHIPYMVSWAYRKDNGVVRTDYVWDIENAENVNTMFIKAIRKRLTDLIKITIEKSKKYGEEESEEKKRFQTNLTLVSHNGSGYDNHVFLRFLNDENVKIKNYIGDSSKIKSLSISFKDIKSSHSITFSDSYLFTNESLENSCKAFDVEGKKDVNIALYLKKEDCIANKKEIVEYGVQDSKCLLHLVENINKSYKEATEVDLSPFRYISLPSYASKIRDYYSDMKNIYYDTRREMVDFEQKSVFGGRLVVGSLYYDSKVEGENMRNPDVNSLYPTAMANYEYPCGPAVLYKDDEKCDELRDKINNLTYDNISIVKCKIKVNTKCIIPMIPNKQDDGSIDTTQNEFICTATSVELLEAVEKGGYKILKVYIYKEWVEKKYIFKSFINLMYNKRLEYKKLLKEATNKTEKKKYDVLQNLCKLIMNSSYGKIIQKPIDSKYTVTTIKEWTNEIADQNTELVSVINGGRNVLYKKKNKDTHDNKLPKYLGAFILSYSKKHMNTLIDAVDGFNKPVIYYFDTDSMYMKSSLFDKLGEKGIIGKELGQASPDYDVDIDEYISLGKKIKFCKLTDGKIKSTFKGYSGLKNLNKEDIPLFFKELKQIALDEKLSSDSKFMTKSITRFNKKGLVITTQELSRDFKPTWQTQYKKSDGGWLYPKYYEF